MIISAEEFIRLRASENPTEYERAVHEEMSLNVWMDLVMNHPDQKVYLVWNKTIPIEILSLLAVDSDDRVRLEVASKRKISKEIFEKLSQDEDEDVRARLALNPKIPREILLKLALDQSNFVRDRALERLNHSR